MTKSIIITYDESDESFLMTLFNKFKIKTQPTTIVTTHADEGVVPSKEEFMNDLRQSVSEMKAHIRGEISLPTFEESMKRIEQELAQEEMTTL